MLARMGWTEGRGLGKREDGRTEHVRVRRRAEALGVGAEGAVGAAPEHLRGRNGNEVLLSAVSEYDDMLRRAAALASTASAREEAEETGEDNDKEGEGAADEAEVKRRRKEQRRADRKRKRREEAEINNSAAPVETVSAPQPTKSVPMGRHHKIMRHKDVSRYSAADMAAILGGGAAGGVRVAFGAMAAVDGPRAAAPLAR